MGELSLRVAKPYLTSFQSLPDSTICGPSAWSPVVISSTRKPQTVILPEASTTETPTLPRGPALACYPMPFSLLPTSSGPWPLPPDHAGIPNQTGDPGTLLTSLRVKMYIPEIVA